MTPERWEQIKEIFYAAQERSATERPAYLAMSCAGDDGLRQEIESLLLSHDQAQEFIENPAFEVAGIDDGETRKFFDQHVGPYKVISEIGRGGMGVVFLAERDDAEFRQRVAVKLIRRGLDTEDVLRRFRNERQILAALNHPNVARLLDGGSTDTGLPYFVMEYIEGLPLVGYCDHNKLHIDERLKLFRKVCAAVAHAHGDLIVHRDLKPSNILVTKTGEPKLLDFGVAKLLKGELSEQPPALTATGLRIMTPEYASPEQVRGLHVTTATDVYSLGVILYELLTGHRPYRLHSHQPGQLARAICEDEPEKPSTAVSRVEEIGGQSGKTLRVTPESVGEARGEPPRSLHRRLQGDLDNIVLMALRKESARRYASVEQLSEDLRRYLEGLPVIAREDSLRYRSAKFVGRHRAAVATAALVILSLIAGLITTIWQSRVARQERDRARIAQAKAERINKFLQDALGAPNPTKEGREVKVIEVLEKAASRAATELADQPEVLAEVQQTIGVTYFNLELYDKAEPLLRSALAIFQRLFGESHPKTAKCLTDLGDLLNYQEKYDEAIAVLQKAIETYRRLTPEHARDLAQARFTLAQTYLFKGDKRSAEPLYREVLDYALKNLGENDSIVGDVSNELANLIRDRDYEQAIALYRRSERIVRPLPEERADLATTLSNLGMVLTDAGRFDEAETSLRESIAIRRELFGDDSPTLSVVKTRLSRVYFYRGDYAKAETEARAAVAIQEKTLAKRHRNFATSYVVLGRALTRNGKLGEAEKLLREGLNLSVEKLSGEDRNRAIAEISLGECLMTQKRFAEAEPLLTRGYEWLKAALGTEDLATREARQQLVIYYESQGKSAEAGRYR